MTAIKETDLSKAMRALADEHWSQKTADQLRAHATEFDERSFEFWSATDERDGKVRVKRMLGAWARARKVFIAAQRAR